MNKSLCNRALAAAGVLAFALPSLALAQADQSQASPSPMAQPSGSPPMAQPSGSPTSPDAAQASSAPMSNTGGAATDDTTGGGNYPPCSATVTDHCMQGGGHAHARARHAKHKA